MKKNNTELVDYFINPSFLEQIKQPVSSINCNNWFSFDFTRNKRKYSITIYTGKEGQVNISTVNPNGMRGRVVLMDYCQNIEDLKGMFEKIDDMAKRMP